jgi:N-acetylmuramoyl-L-alanine amidase
MIKICLQAGHWNVTTGQTGAPGEQELNVRIMMRLKDILISKGFQLFLVDANPPADQISQDFDLFLALHGDANIYGTGGGVITAPDPNYDSVNAESKRIAQCIQDEYFNHSGIVNHPERINVNMTRYYMWNLLTRQTPCVILEMGVVQDAHDKVILADTDRVCNAIARGICKAFNVPFETTTTTNPTSTSTSTSTTTQTTTTPMPVSDCKTLVKQIHDIIWGSGWPWVKNNKIKAILPK